MNDLLEARTIMKQSKHEYGKVSFVKSALRMTLMLGINVLLMLAALKFCENSLLDLKSSEGWYFFSEVYMVAAIAILSLIFFLNGFPGSMLAKIAVGLGFKSFVDNKQPENWRTKLNKSSRRRSLTSRLIH